MQMRFALLTLLTTSCALVPPDRAADNAADDELRGLTAGTPKACLPRDQGNLMVLDRQRLIVRSGVTRWVNQLRSECPGLRPLDTIIVENLTGSICSGDHVRTISSGMSIPGPICVLGNFTPYRR